MPSVWRLVRSEPASGAWNMAVDEAILEAAAAGQSPPTLRLYAWEPPCLSLGFAQPAAEVDLDTLQRLGWGLVRRPTGGRAILHADELTYSVAGPASEPRLAGSVLESYHRLSDALLDALHRLGVPAEANESAAPPGSDLQGPVCFEVPSNYEITVNGKKLVGSAQSRRKNSVLQHGSLPLSGDLSRILQALHFDSPAARREAAVRLHARAATLEEILGQPVAWETAARVFEDAFASTLRLNLLPGALRPAELQRAQELFETKYSQDSWNFKY